MALLLPGRQHSCRFLLNHAFDHQLACDGLLLCLRRGSPSSHIHAPSWWSSIGYNCMLGVGAFGQLDPLWRHKSIPAFLRPHHLRPDTHWVRATVRSGCSYKVLGSLVFATRKGHGHGNRVARESIRRCPRTVDQPFACNKDQRNPQHDALCCHNQHRGDHSVPVHTCKPSDAGLSILYPYSTNIVGDDPASEPQHHLLFGIHSLLGLRRILQFQ